MQKEELRKFKYFTLQKYTLQKKFSIKKKTPQNPSRYYYYNSIITNLQVSTQAKISSFKNPHIKNKIDLLLLLPRGQNPLNYYTL
jgi:hypothetical protein